MGQIVNLSSEVPANFWESRLITDELMQAAQDDPALWARQSKLIAKFDVNLRNGSLAWQEGAQLALKQVAGSSGVPASSAVSLADNVVGFATGHPLDAEQLALDLTMAGIGVATNLLAAIPIVGQIAGAVGAMAQLLISLSRDKIELAKEALPPFVDYTDEVDEYVVNNQVIPSLGTLDWTGILLPRYSGTWEVHDREHGWAMKPSGGSGGVGFVPGTERMSGILQTYFHYKSVRKGFQMAIARDQGLFYPGAAQMMTAQAAQISKVQTQLFNVDTHEIERRWRDYYAGAIELATAIYERPNTSNSAIPMWGASGLDGTTREQGRAVARAMMSPLLVGVGGSIGGMGTNSWEPSHTGHVGTRKGAESVLHRYILPWCHRIRMRQIRHLGTIVGTAYTDEDQGAFRGSPSLLATLRENRGLLLNSQYKRNVDLKEMIDRSYAQEIQAVTAGATYSPGPQAAGSPFPRPTGPDVPAEPPGGGAPFGMLGEPAGPGGGLKPFLIGAAAIGVAGVVARKKGWI